MIPTETETESTIDYVQPMKNPTPLDMVMHANLIAENVLVKTIRQEGKILAEELRRYPPPGLTPEWLEKICNTMDPAEDGLSSDARYTEKMAAFTSTLSSLDVVYTELSRVWTKTFQELLNAPEEERNNIIAKELWPMMMAFFDRYLSDDERRDWEALQAEQ